MKKIILLFFLFGIAIPVFSQGGFEFVKTENRRIAIPFKLINNLTFIPVKVNGVELLFLLDTGVSETILFGFEDTEMLHLNQIEKISIQGLGGNEAVQGIRSSGNILSINKIVSKNHLLYLILDPSFNLSAYVGVNINGIIGSSFFENHFVQIDYSNKMIHLYNLNSNFEKKIQKYTKVPLLIEKRKPYLNARVQMNNSEVDVKLLVDSGNSDAIWLFDEVSDKVQVPQKHFDDYLGQGLSGVVEGKRARIDVFSIANFDFKAPIVAFPNFSSIKHISFSSNRLGSIGGEILKRFLVVFDYTNGLLYLKKNKFYKNKFYYNKSGIEVWRTGMQLVRKMVVIPDKSLVLHPEELKYDDSNGSKTNVKYKVELKPVYEIGYIRPNSKASECGLLAGDVLREINGKDAFDYSLQEINALLWSEKEIWIELKILRDGVELNFKFELIDIL
jgi:hypothetical protein